MSCSIRASAVAMLLVAALLLVSQNAAAGRYDSVEEFLDRGSLDSAFTELEEILEDDYLDLDALYYYAKLEPKGELAIEYLQKSLLLCDDLCGRNPAELADAYWASGRYYDVIELYKEYRKDIDFTHDNVKLYWLTGMAYLKVGEYSKAEDVFDDIRKRFDDPLLAEWCRLGKASAKASRKDIDDARDILKPLISSGGALGALAIYNRAFFEAERGRRESALLGYNILDEKYDEFIGATELADAILSTGAGTSAEQAVDLTYTVEMGIFGDRDEANELVARLKANQWTPFLSSRIVGDRKYWVVRVGIFRSQQSAQESREKLEQLFPGSYRVVVR